MSLQRTWESRAQTAAVSWSKASTGTSRRRNLGLAVVLQVVDVIYFQYGDFHFDSMDSLPVINLCIDLHTGQTGSGRSVTGIFGGTIHHAEPCVQPCNLFSLPSLSHAHGPWCPPVILTCTHLPFPEPLLLISLSSQIFISHVNYIMSHWLINSNNFPHYTPATAKLWKFKSKNSPSQ